MRERPVSAPLPGGRLSLRHGPIDLVIGAEGPGRAAALEAAEARFATILEELCAELPLLRRPVAERPEGETARLMWAATRPHADRAFVTPMAAVAGAVAETVLAAMRRAGPLARAHVNNGGDIALHLSPRETFDAAIRAPDGREIGRFRLSAGGGIGGVATSGRGGRSFSLGIAESVTVLAETAAAADAAATLIGNAIDLPGHPAITRAPARSLAPDSDLGERPVVTGLGPLSPAESRCALAAGLAEARRMRAAGLIRGAVLALGGETLMLDPEERLAHA
ncbi:MAG: UPF0280 family protein [Pikeienuella sp.]|uniref:UPF0280 family protein n=1 Tax=Pikeienuella sp. TaxID=2831957 RepID=UPI00391D7A0C